MGIARTTASTALMLAAAAVAAGVVYMGRAGLQPAEPEKPIIEGVRKPLFPENGPRTVALASIGGEGLGSTRGDFAISSAQSSIAALPAVDAPTVVGAA